MQDMNFEKEYHIDHEKTGIVYRLVIITIIKKQLSSGVSGCSIKQ